MASTAVGSNLNVGQTTVGTTAGLLLAGRTVRKSVRVKNLDATATDLVYVGDDSGVTTANGYVVAAAGGELVLDDYNGPIYAIATSADTPVTFVEVF